MKQLTFFIFLLISITAFAQQADTTIFKGLRYIDKVKMKQGNFYQGKIVEMDEKIIVMDILGGFRLHLNRNDIQKIQQQCLNCNIGNNNDFLETYNFREKGIYTHLAGGVISGDENPGYSFHATIGKMKRRTLGFGGGIGIFAYENNRYLKQNFIPVFGEIRSYLKAKKNAPFVAMKAGYGMVKKAKTRGSWEQEPSKQLGGLFLNPSIGFRLGASDDINFIFDFGFLFQQSRNNYKLDESGIGTEWIKYRYQRWQLSVGILF
jgi:hypothetical protein